MKKYALAASIGLALCAAQNSAQAQTSFFGLLSGGTSIQTFNLAGTASLPFPVTGLSGGDTLVDIDVRPFNGALYGMGSSGTLYILSPGAVSFTASVDVANAIPGATAMDFNPVANRLRVYAGTSNFRLTPGTGVLTADGTLDYSAGDPNDASTPNLRAAAYINSFLGATATTLYSIDPTLDILVVHPAAGGPAFSQLTTQNGLTLAGNPFNAGNNIGFDVLSNGVSNTPYFSNDNNLYTINLNAGQVGGAAGQLTFVSTVGGGSITDIAVVPEPGVIGLFGLGLAGLIGRRRRQA